MFTPKKLILDLIMNTGRIIVFTTTSVAQQQINFVSMTNIILFSQIISKLDRFLLRNLSPSIKPISTKKATQAGRIWWQRFFVSLPKVSRYVISATGFTARLAISIIWVFNWLRPSPPSAIKTSIAVGGCSATTITSCLNL